MARNYAESKFLVLPTLRILSLAVLKPGSTISANDGRTLPFEEQEASEKWLP